MGIGNEQKEGLMQSKAVGYIYDFESLTGAHPQLIFVLQLAVLLFLNAEIQSVDLMEQTID